MSSSIRRRAWHPCLLVLVGQAFADWVDTFTCLWCGSSIYICVKCLKMHLLTPWLYTVFSLRCHQMLLPVVKDTLHIRGFYCIAYSGWAGSLCMYIYIIYWPHRLPRWGGSLRRWWLVWGHPSWWEFLHLQWETLHGPQYKEYICPKVAAPYFS